MAINPPVQPPRRSVPLGLVGAMVLIVGFELHIERNALDYLVGSQLGCKIASEVAATKVKDCKVLVFGDSLLKLGLAPKVVEAESGLRGYNLAIAGGQAPGSYFLLRKALESGAQPRAIVVDFFPWLLGVTPQFNDENWPSMLSLRDCFDLALELGSLDEFARLAVLRLIPSARSRKAIRSKINLALQPSPISVRFEMLRAIRNWKANQGAEITPSRPNFAYDLDVWERCNFASFECLPTNQVYVDKFLDLAASRQIPVFWLLPPYQPVMQERCERSGFDRRHETYVKAIQAKHPGLFVVDARHSGYEPNIFVDYHHLGRQGAAVFSAEVGQMIRRGLRELDSQNRWTALPRYRSRPEAAPLEDGEESRMVVWRESQVEQGRKRLK